MNIHFAKTHLSSLLEEVSAGNEIIVARAGKPVARLVPYISTTAPRKLGLLAGQLSQHADCWKADSELEDSFYRAVLPAPPCETDGEPATTTAPGKP